MENRIKRVINVLQKKLDVLNELTEKSIKKNEINNYIDQSLAISSCIRLLINDDYLEILENYYNINKKITIKKVFNVKKFEEVMLSLGVFKKAIEEAKFLWANDCHGLTAEEMEKNGYLTADEWMIEIKVN